MGTIGRNEPCSCGSGLKAKRCCLAEEGSRISNPKATLARLQPAVAKALDGVPRTAFHDLYDEVIYLPELDVSLQVRLPGILTVELDEALEAAMAALPDGEEDFDEALLSLCQSVDSTERRLELAEAVLAARDRNVISPKLAAVAIFDLNQDHSALFISAVAQAVAVRSGEERTPSGLLVASR